MRITALSPAFRAAAVAALSLFALAPQGRAQVNVLTQHNDGKRTGANLSETVLTTSNVNSTKFGKLFTLTVDGQTYAQPLYVANVAIPSKGTHNVLYVATAHDTVFAFDADAGGTALWSVNLGPSIPNTDLTFAGASSCNPSQTGPYPDMGPEIGIASTPVIDTTTGTLYCLARSHAGGIWTQKLHALDITTGAEKFGGPAAVPTPMTPFQSGQQQRTFDLSTQNQRAALALANGAIYICWASHGDCGSYNGWVMNFDAATLAFRSAFCDTPTNDPGMAGIWMTGQGPAIDASGNLYISTGNGSPYGGLLSEIGTPDFGSSFVKLGPASTMAVADYFVPYNMATINSNDWDLASAGILLLPGTTFMVGTHKGGEVYLIDTTNMTHFYSGSDLVTQEFPITSNLIYSSPVYWSSPSNGPTVYISSSGDPIKAFKFTGGLFQTTPISQTPLATPTGEVTASALSISANGSTAGTGILWAAGPVSADPGPQAVPGIIRAFDASNLGTELWDSQQVIGRDDLGNYAKFTPPTIANGKLYAPTFSNQIVVYGILPTGIPPAPTGLTATAGNAQVALTWNASTGATAYDVKRSTVSGGGYVTVSSPTVTNFTNTGLTNGTTYYFVVDAKNASGTSANSTQASATPQVTIPPVPTGLTATPGDAQVALTWNASTGATAYDVKRSTVSGSGYVTVSSPTTTSYTNTGLTNGTTYYYVVAAKNAAGSSANSSQVAATPAAGPTQAQIPNTATAPTIDGNIDAVWSTAASYNITHSSGTISNGADLSASWQGLWDATNLYILVTVTDDVKINDSTNPWDDDSVELYLDADHNGGTVYDANDRQVVCGWGDATPVEGAGRAIAGTAFGKADPTGTSYRIEAKIPWTVEAFTPAANAIIGVDVHVDDDDNGGARDGKLMWNDTTDMAWTNPSLFGTGKLLPPAGGPPPAPTGLTATPGNAQVALSWTASSGATSYNVLRSTVNGSGYASVATGIAVTSYTNTGLINGTTYYFVATATNASGTSGNSNQASATPQPGIPAAPTGLTATPGNAQAALTWTASGGATSYNVKRSTVNGSGYVTVASPTVTNYTNTGLANGTTYYFVVTAVNVSGESGNSNQASATPSAGGGGTLLASEPFGEATGALQGANTGTGWSGAWNTQNNDVTVPGYNVSAGTLTYTGLTTTVNHGIGGAAFLTTGRGLDVTAGGAFGTNGYLTGGNIGASGKTLWMSFLIRKDAATEQENSLRLHASTIVWNSGTGIVSVGYFGSSSDNAGSKFWTLKIGSTVLRTTVPITIGTTSLLVVQMNFGATNTISLYVNPTSLGGSAPGTATISGTTTSSIAFKSLAYYAGDGTNQSSIDEIRFGDTYAAVTH